MTSKDMDMDTLRMSLKSLLIGIGPFIRNASSVEEAEETLLHLEEKDVNFHNYEFVCKLRSQISVRLEHLIDEEIDKHSIHPNDSTSGLELYMNRIVEKILQSREYSELKKSLHANVNDACSYWLNHLEEILPKADSHGGMGGGQAARRRHVDSASDEELSFESSLNQSTLMFMNREQFQNLVDSLDKHKTVEIRRQALNSLLQLASLDNWESLAGIKQGLQYALMDNDHELWTQSLRVIARVFSYNNQGTKEMYLTLVDYLSLQFQASAENAIIPKLSAGVDCRQPEIIKLVKAFRLLNDFQHQIPQYWVRYPNKFLEDVLQRTISLFAIGQQSGVSSPSMTPLHFISLLDTRSNWFNKWMHGHYSRAPLLNILQQQRTIVEHAVKCCLDYSASIKSAMEQKLSDDSNMETTPRLSETPTAEKSAQKRVEYSASQLEFTYFIHSLSLLSRLLCYEQGRSLFPLKIPGREGDVTHTNLLVSLISMLTNVIVRQNLVSQCKNLLYEPCCVIVEVLKKLCTSENVCSKCMCKDAITDALLVPISTWISADTTRGPAISDSMLLQLAEILSVLASTSVGRRHLLYGESLEKSSSTKLSPIRVLLNFTKKAMQDKASSFEVVPSKAVVGNVLFVCRQLYSSTTGLNAVYSHNLHTIIADAWRVANRDLETASTPTPSLTGNETTSSQFVLMWEEILLDNLLSFSSTPKGLFLLQQTGVIGECVSYMCRRYVGKLQVSKYEKFGYGYMMSQVGATAAGTIALLSLDFIEKMVRATWGVLEITDDNPLYTPRSWPVESIDKTAKKCFTNLINLLSSYSAVYELLVDKPLPNRESYSLRDVPSTLTDLLDRLVFVETNEKIVSLFNYEQSHVFGLRLLSCMTSCLDTFLLLETQYSIQDMLLRCQADNVSESGSQIIIDCLSVERNYVLVKTYLIGGPTERVLPRRRPLAERNTDGPLVLFSKYPTPNEYVTTIHSSAKQPDSDLRRFLLESKNDSSGTQWLDKCRRILANHLINKKEPTKGIVFQDLMERFADVISRIHAETVFSRIQCNETATKGVKLSAQQELGVKLTIRYGCHLKIISNNKEIMTDKLTSLIKRTLFALQQQQRKKLGEGSQLACLRHSSISFDWFVATVFLMMGGNTDRSWKFLQHVSTLPASGLMWLQRLHASTHLPQSVVESAIPPVFYRTGHMVEYILQAEEPHVYSAFKMSGYTPAQICQNWIRQCFWNYLDWTDICHYIIICLVYGADYQVYACVAILHFLKEHVLKQTQNKELIVYLKEQSIGNGFHFSNHFKFMSRLEDKYRSAILEEMKNLSKS